MFLLERISDRSVQIGFVSYCMGNDSFKAIQKYYANYRDKNMLSSVYGILNGRSAT
ncbi:MAG: hypothetical protein J5485_01560 [Candidatus Methanomethylophilaceae archaeon]|nr:hypothetical protein [Candidatus Methanomethylophilaceae archaeon]